MQAVKGVGEPCAGETHARIEVAAGGTRNQSGQHVPRGTRRLSPTLQSRRHGDKSLPLGESIGAPRAKDVGLGLLCAMPFTSLKVPSTLFARAMRCPRARLSR